MEGRGVGGRIKAAEIMDCIHVRQAARASAAHALLLTFTIVLVRKLHHPLSFPCSWWLVFCPLWLFHIVVAKGRFSMPVPGKLEAPLWDPFHAVVAAPLLVAFEVLLCLYLDCFSVNHVPVMNLNIVFLPLYLLEVIIIIDNLRMYSPLFEVENATIGVDREFRTESARRKKVLELEPIYSKYGMIALYMTFNLVATVWMVQLIVFNADAKFFGFPFVISSFGHVYTFFVFLGDNNVQWSARLCNLQWFVRLCNGLDIWAPIFLFHILVLANDGVTPIPYAFSPLFFFQGRVVLFSISQLLERIFSLLQHSEARNGRPLKLISRAHDFLEILHHDSGFIGWWSVDEVSKEGQAHRIHHNYVSGCNQFCGSPPDLVKKMSKKDLVEEVFTMQDAIKKQIKVAEYAQEEYKQLHRVFTMQGTIRKQIKVAESAQEEYKQLHREKRLQDLL